MFILFLAFIGVLISLIILLFNAKNKFLAIFFAMNSLYGAFHYILFYSKSTFWVSALLVYSFPIFFLFGPFFYFYIRGVLRNDYAITKKDWYHFIPFVISILFIIPYILQSADIKKQFVVFFITLNEQGIQSLHIPLASSLKNYFLMKNTIIVLYIGYCAIWFQREYKNQILLLHKNAINWLKIVLFLSFVGNLLPLIFTLNYIVKSDGIQPKIAGILSITFLGLILNLSVFLFPQVLYGSYLIKNKKQLSPSKKQVIAPANEEINELEITLNNYILSHPYLHKNFTKSKLLVDLNISDKLFTFYFNEHLGTNFHLWKSNLRIDYSVQLIESNFLKNRTVESLAKEVGFQSRNKFSEAFKKRYNVLPSEYVKSTK